MGVIMAESEIVSVAATQQLREAIYRFRYQVYIEELKRDYPDADHERKWLRSRSWCVYRVDCWEEENKR